MKTMTFFAFFAAMIVCSLALFDANEEGEKKREHPLKRIARYIGTNDTSCLKPGATCGGGDKRSCCGSCFECTCSKNSGKCNCNDTCKSGK
nr:venom gland protein U6-PHTX-Pmx1c [Physocyclus mexicanus]